MTDLRCPFCGGVPRIVCEYVGRPYLAENTPTGIECDGPPDGYGCGAEWEPDGTLRTPGPSPAVHSPPVEREIPRRPPGEASPA